MREGCARNRWREISITRRSPEWHDIALFSSAIVALALQIHPLAATLRALRGKVAFFGVKKKIPDTTL
jgi:hypothetical protein